MKSQSAAQRSLAYRTIPARQENADSRHQRVYDSVVDLIANPDNPTPTTVDKVIAVADKAAPRLEAIIKNVIGKLC